MLRSRRAHARLLNFRFSVTSIRVRRVESVQRVYNDRGEKKISNLFLKLLRLSHSRFYTRIENEIAIFVDLLVQRFARSNVT